VDLELDNDGYLQDRSQWNEAIAAELASAEQLELTPAHWELIWLVRDFYERFEVSPAMRPLVKQVRERLGPEKGNSIYLMKLFPGSPPKLLAKLAGLPRPTNCL
jgi:tRNA 2-thiouridine synthesizing protein E